MRLIELQIERPKSDKNFPRNIMPQIRKGDIKDSHFDYTKEKIDITKLKPVQNQRVKGMHDRAKRGFADGSIRPIVIDKNNYIVNGHHRFDVALQMGIKDIKVLRVDATIEELIDHFSNTSSDAPTFEELMKQKLAKAMEGEVVTFPGTYVKREYVTINGVKMLKDVWDYMSQEREHEHGYDKNANTVHKGLGNFTGEEDPRILKKAYQVELRNFIDEFENQDMDPQPFIDELEQLDENAVDLQKFINELVPTDVGVDTVGDYVIHYEGFTDECNEGHDDESIDEVYAQVYQDFDDRQGQKAIDRGVAYEDLGVDNNPVLYSVYKNVNERNLNPAVKDYIKGKKTKLIKVKVADLDDEAIDDRFGRVIDVDPDVGVDLDEPILVDVDGKTILDGFHRVYQAKRVGRNVIPAEIIDENFADGKKKGKSRPGRVKKAGASCKGSVSSLRAKAKKYGGEKGKMYHWCANMKAGKKK